MISFTSGATLFQTLSQNTSSANATLYGLLANIEHRYLLQKYFANRGRIFHSNNRADLVHTCFGGCNGATSCTLNSPWAYQTTQAQFTFSDGEAVNALFTNGSATVTWTPALQGTLFSVTATPAAGATSATLTSAWTYPTGAYLTSFSDGSIKDGDVHKWFYCNIVDGWTC